MRPGYEAPDAVLQVPQASRCGIWLCIDQMRAFLQEASGTFFIAARYSSIKPHSAYSLRAHDFFHPTLAEKQSLAHLGAWRQLQQLTLSPPPPNRSVRLCTTASPISRIICQVDATTGDVLSLSTYNQAQNRSSLCSTPPNSTTVTHDIVLPPRAGIRSVATAGLVRWGCP
jgi:hypothetical protein